MDREKIMQQWDSWVNYIATGGETSWPRDAFENILDRYDEEVKLWRTRAADAQHKMGACENVRLQQEISRLREAAYRLFNVDGSTIEPVNHFNEAIADLWNLLQALEGGDG